MGDDCSSLPEKIIIVLQVVLFKPLQGISHYV